jgi:hypothetical protein
LAADVVPGRTSPQATPSRTTLFEPTLPARLASAIEEKLGAEREIQRMQSVLAKERQEADRLCPSVLPAPPRGISSRAKGQASTFR